MKLIGSLAVALVIATSGLAHADLSKKVQKALTGQIIITDGPLAQEGASDAETIAAFKKANLKEVKHTEVEDVAEWTFDYTAFLKKPPKVSNLSIDFYTADREKRYVANKGLMGVDPNLPVLTGTLTISEDDGPTRGKTYVIKITGKVKGKEVTFAETKLKLK